MYQKKLVGVANFVVSGCGTTHPDGYAKVSYYTRWILDNVGNIDGDVNGIEDSVEHINKS